MDDNRTDTKRPQARPGPTEANETGEHPSVVIPRIVKAVTAAPALLALVLALIAALAVVLFADDFRRSAGATFALVLGLLTGQQVGVSGSAIMVGQIDVSGAAAPFGVMLLAAFALRRLPFTRPWLGVDEVRLRGAVTGALAMLAAALLGKLVGNVAGVAAEGLFVEVTYGLRPLVPVLVGAAVWPLAVTAHRHTVADRLLTVVVGALGVFTVLGWATALTAGGPGEVIAALAAVSIVMLFWGLNLLAAALQLPFGGILSGGASATTGGMYGYAGSGFSDWTFTQIAAASGWVWLLPLAVLAVMFAAGYLQPLASSWDELAGRVRTFALFATGLLLPVTMFGDLELSGGGLVSLVGSTEATLWAGMAGLPWRFALPLLVWSLATAVGLWVAAQRAGHPWARTDQLGQAWQTISTSTVSAARDAAQRARRMAERAQAPTGQASTPIAQPTPPTQSQIRHRATELGLSTDQLEQLAGQAGVTSQADLSHPDRMRRLAELLEHVGAAAQPRDDESVDWSR